jgi:hypothetical protein
MQLPTLNVNIIIIAVLLSVSFYGLLAGKQRLRILILSVYVGIVLAEQLGSHVARLPQNAQPHPGQLGPVWAAHPHLRLCRRCPLQAPRPRGRPSPISSSASSPAPSSFRAPCTSCPPAKWPPSTTIPSWPLTSSNSTYWILGLLPVVALLMGFMRNEKKGHQ